jgi:hypothetical protein
MRSQKITPQQEEDLMKITGLTRADLYNRRGGLSERGLAPLLESTDRITEIKEDHVVITTADGSIQTFWNMRLDLPFIRSCEGQSSDALKSEDGNKKSKSVTGVDNQESDGSDAT